MNNDLTYEYLIEALDYNQDTGIFKWKERPRKHFKTDGGWKCTNTMFSGKEAGTIWTHKKCKNKYFQISISKKTYKSHRLAWLYVYGEWPKNEIDHINGNGLDNRIVNLRDSTKEENQKNKSIPANNSTGVIGVYWDKHKGKWTAFANGNGKMIYLGQFDCKLDAIDARKSAESQYGYHANHGRVSNT